MLPSHNDITHAPPVVGSMCPWNSSNTSGTFVSVFGNFNCIFFSSMAASLSVSVFVLVSLLTPTLVSIYLNGDYHCNRHIVKETQSDRHCWLDLYLRLFTKEPDIHCSVHSLCSIQPMWTHPTGNFLMFVGTTLASLASGPACSSQWCHLLEPWWFTGSSCPISSTTQDSLSTVSHNALVSTRKDISHHYVVPFGWLFNKDSTHQGTSAVLDLALPPYSPPLSAQCQVCASWHRASCGGAFS